MSIKVGDYVRTTEEYEELKKHTRAGISIGFLIRESIHQYLQKNKKN